MPLHAKLSLFAYVISGERSANRPKKLRNDAFQVKTSQSAKNQLDPAKNENRPKFDICPFCTKPFNCFPRSNTKFTLIHKCMPLPTRHQDGVENCDKAYCRFASPICNYLLFNKKKYKLKVNYYLGMKDMLRDIDARSCNICG